MTTACQKYTKCILTVDGWASDITLEKFKIPFTEDDLRPEGDEQKRAMVNFLKEHFSTPQPEIRIIQATPVENKDIKESREYLLGVFNTYREVIDIIVVNEGSEAIGIIQQKLNEVHHHKLNKLSTPQPENVPDTMLASEDVLKKDWDSPAEDEAWKDLTDENVCEWVKVKDGLYQTGCQLEEDLWFYDDKMTYCPSCAKPIKTICTPQQEEGN